MKNCKLLKKLTLWSQNGLVLGRDRRIRPAGTRDLSSPWV
jgi:hypothetical protein